MKQVILSADDFGLDVAVNEAIELAHRDGILSSASIMVGEQAAGDAIDRARRLPELRVGLHITLIEGTPVLSPHLIPDLVDAHGRFPSNMVASGFKFFFLPQVRRQLTAEITAQFEAFAKAGLPLDHVNTHKHIHLHPTVAGMIMQIGRRFGLRAMRVPQEPPAPLASAANQPRESIGGVAIRLWTGQLRATIRRAGLVANDHVFGLAWSGAMTEERLLALIPHLPDGISEIYFHPASSLTPRLAQTMPDYRHADELAALLSPRVRAAIESAGIQRTSFGCLAGVAG